MPLLAGTYSDNGTYSTDHALYALENAFSQAPSDMRLKTETFNDVGEESLGISLDPIGFDGWKLISKSGTRNLYLVPPGYSINLLSPCCAYMGSDVSTSHTNCLVAHDNNLNSVLMAFYNSRYGPSIDNDITTTNRSGSYSARIYINSSDYSGPSWRKSVDPGIVFIAKDTNGDVFGGGGCGYMGPPMIASFIGKNGGLTDLQFSYTTTTTNTQTHNIHAYPPFYPRENFNTKGELYLANMVNYTSNSLALAKTMKTGITVPKVEDDQTKFITCYKIGNQKFINFGNHGSQEWRIPLVDPWCPF